MVWTKIAIRNLMKNGRRSFFTIIAITLGYAAIVLFDGFITYMFTGLKESVIYAQGGGHLTVFKKGYLEKGKLHPEQYLITNDELRAIDTICAKRDEILVTSPELNINGLISNGHVSTIFIATGRVPSKHQAIKNHSTSKLGASKYYEGEPLTDDNVSGIGIGSSLSRLMGLPAGSSDAIVVAPTVDGAMNALDAKIIQTVQAGNEVLEDKLLTVSLDFAQTLYDTESVDRVRILLANEQDIASVTDYLKTAFENQEMDLEIKEWIELSPFYVKVKNMFEFIFIFVFLIVITVVVMSIINTLGMAIMERTTEIGTMRAMGLKRFGVIRLFAIESSILVLIGAFLGLIIALSARSLIEIFDVRWIPPQLALAVPLEIHLVYGHMLAILVLLELLAVAAAIMPARRAAYKNIVDALGHT